MTERLPAATRARSVVAARCALLSTVALVATAATQGSARSLFAFIWVTLALAAMGFQWNARRQERRDDAVRRPPRPRAAARAARRSR